MPPLPADSIHARACKLKCEKILTRPSYWAYHDIVEATNAHSYRVYDGEEHWM